MDVLGVVADIGVAVGVTSAGVAMASLPPNEWVDVDGVALSGSISGLFASAMLCSTSSRKTFVYSKILFKIQYVSEWMRVNKHHGSKYNLCI